MNQARRALIVTLAIQVLAAWAALTGPMLAPLAAGDIGVAPYLVGIYVSVKWILSFESGGIRHRRTRQMAFFP